MTSTENSKTSKLYDLSELIVASNLNYSHHNPNIPVRLIKIIIIGMAQELQELAEKLDNLLEKYLGLLDDYDKARKQLSSSAASVRTRGPYEVIPLILNEGFFSIAQANKASSNKRYGSDFYDYRMQASRKV